MPNVPMPVVSPHQTFRSSNSRSWKSKVWKLRCGVRCETVSYRDDLAVDAATDGIPFPCGLRRRGAGRLHGADRAGSGRNFGSGRTEDGGGASAGAARQPASRVSTSGRLTAGAGGNARSGFAVDGGGYLRSGGREAGRDARTFADRAAGPALRPDPSATVALHPY